MRASELIAELQRAVEQYGDLRVIVRDCPNGYSYTEIIVSPDPASEWERDEGVEGTIDLCVL